MTHISQELSSEIIRNYLEGISSETVGRKYGITGTAVLTLVREAGMPVRTKGGSAKIYDAGWTERFITAYKSGMTILEIAQYTGVGQGTIWRSLRKAGVATRPHGMRKQTITVPNEPAVLGYIAGLLDGEGTLQFKPSHNNSSIGCRLSIANNHRGVHTWLQQTIGGHVHWRQHKFTDLKPTGVWQVYRARDMIALLRALMPYLIIKKDAAEAALAFFDAKFYIQNENASSMANPDGEKNVAHLL